VRLVLLCCVAAGEQVSEEEESGVDEDLDQTATTAEDVNPKRRKSCSKNKKAKQTNTLLPRLL